MTARSILLIEDNPADVRFTLDAFRLAAPDVTVEVCEDGESALQLLRDPAHPRPCLILLDLNLPGLDGREVLEAIKGDPDLGGIPICILTTSQAHDDVDRAYARHANSYVVKPVGLPAFRTAIEQIERYWFGTVQLPGAPG